MEGRVRSFRESKTSCPIDLTFMVILLILLTELYDMATINTNHNNEKYHPNVFEKSESRSLARSLKRLILLILLISQNKK